MTPIVLINRKIWLYKMNPHSSWKVCTAHKLHNLTAGWTVTALSQTWEEALVKPLPMPPSLKTWISCSDPLPFCGLWHLTLLLTGGKSRGSLQEAYWPLSACYFRTQSHSLWYMYYCGSTWRKINTTAQLNIVVLSQKWDTGSSREQRRHLTYINICRIGHVQ